MPRYRKLYVKATESLDINDMPDDFHRLLWVMLPLGLDREGRGVDNAGWVKAKIMPLRTDVSLDMVSDALDWFTQRGMIKRYQVEGRGYFWAPTFHSYQGTTTKEAESNYPAPPVEVESLSRAGQEPVESRSSTDAVCSMQYADADADADAEAEQQPPADSEQARKAELFALIENSGVMIGGSMQVEAWLELFEITQDIGIVHLAFEECAKQGKRPSPKYIGAIVRRCVTNGVRPGEWGQGGSRASPPSKPLSEPPPCPDDLVNSLDYNMVMREKAEAKARNAASKNNGQGRDAPPP